MRVIGLDEHRSMAVIAILENGHLNSGDRVDLTRDAVIAFGRKLRFDDEVVIEATVNTATIVRLLRLFGAVSGDRQPVCKCAQSRTPRSRPTRSTRPC